MIDYIDAILDAYDKALRDSSKSLVLSRRRRMQQGPVQLLMISSS
jgi:hypothetical protein